jgi:hypothetical protein
MKKFRNSSFLRKMGKKKENAPGIEPSAFSDIL